MPVSRETVLEQALIAMVGAAKGMGIETDILVSQAFEGLIANASYRWIQDGALRSVMHEMAMAHFFQEAGPEYVGEDR